MRLAKSTADFFIWHLRLLEKGRNILLKDNMIDEDKAKKEEAAQMTIKDKLDTVGRSYGKSGWPTGKRQELKNCQ